MKAKRENEIGLTVILHTHLVFGGYTPGYPWLPITPESPVMFPPHVKVGLDGGGEKVYYFTKYEMLMACERQ